MQFTRILFARILCARILFAAALLLVCSVASPADAQQPQSETGAAKPGIAESTLTRPDSAQKKRKTVNRTRKTTVEYWKRVAAAGRKLKYPTIRLDEKARIGHVGVGDSKQKFNLIHQVDTHQYLMSEAKFDGSIGATFLFRGFDFSTIPVGTLLPAPGLCEINGRHEYRDETNRQRTALIVQPIAKKDFPIPPASALAELAPKKQASAPKSQKPKESDTAKVSQQTKPDKTQSVGEPPKFKERVWRTKDKKFAEVGKLVGVGDEVIWLRVKSGKVIRIELDRLTQSDRAHAVSKRRAILQYRKLKKQLSDSVQ